VDPLQVGVFAAFTRLLVTQFVVCFEADSGTTFEEMGGQEFTKRGEDTRRLECSRNSGEQKCA